MARLDAVVEKASARKNTIRSYPTMKLFKYAVLLVTPIITYMIVLYM